MEMGLIWRTISIPSGEIQAGKQWQFNTHTRVCHSHKHALMHANTCTHEHTHNTILRYFIRLFSLVLINCIIWTANPSCQCNNNMADKWTGFFNRSHDFTVLLWGLTAGLLIHAVWKSSGTLMQNIILSICLFLILTSLWWKHFSSNSDISDITVTLLICSDKSIYLIKTIYALQYCFFSLSW